MPLSRQNRKFITISSFSGGTHCDPPLSGSYPPPGTMMTVVIARAGGGATGSSVEGDDEMTRAMDHLRRCAAASKPASPLGALRPLRTKASLQPTRLYNGGACVN